MKTRVITIQRDETVDRAQTQLAVHAIRHLPVLEGQRLVGVVTDRNVLGVMVQQRRGSTPRVHHIRLKSCDTTLIASSLRRAGYRVLERHG